MLSISSRPQCVNPYVSTKESDNINYIYSYRYRHCENFRADFADIKHDYTQEFYQSWVLLIFYLNMSE